MPKLTAPPPAPWMPTDYEDADVYAIKALAAGTANEQQQKRATQWIIYKCARAYDMSYRPTGATDTAFAEGRRAVGLELVKLINLDLEVVRQAEKRKGTKK